MEWINWAIIAGIFIVAEMFSMTFVLLWFGLGALIAALLSYFGIASVWQWVAFGAVSLSMYFIFKNNPNIWAAKNNIKFGAERIVGEIGIVMEDINPIENKGAVKVLGETWKAYTVGTEIIQKDKLVEVVKIDGTKIFVKQINNLGE